MNYKRSLIISVAILTLVSCIPAKKSSVEPSRKEYSFYPSLPTPPKFQYLTSFTNSKDIEEKTNKFLKFVAGEEEAKKIRTIGKAYGVASLDGEIYVCDMTSGGLVVLDLKNKQFRYIGIKGSGRLGKPINLAVDKGSQLIYVSDMAKGQILVFKKSGEYVRAYGEPNQFAPTDVGIDKGRLYVCDVKEHKIHVLDIVSGRILFTIGEPGSGQGQLFHPTNISINHEKIYVSDTSNFRVQVFDLEGHFLSTFGSVGDRPGNFSRNKGITVDPDGNIYVVDAAFENIQVFNEKHELLLFFLEPGNEKPNINLPADVYIDYDNMEYFKDYLAPGFIPQYLLFVTSQYGFSKVNVYAFGDYRP